ncbi:MAG TPA: hypothetical protein VMT67_16980 [Terriglobales bacterium]|nr:hypothetical protein [Terriglobales bacterium]
MFRLRLRASHFFSGILYSLILVFVIAASANRAAAAGPPTGENAYCGKGDVPHFGDKDGPAQLPQACYYTGLDGTPSPGKQIRVGAKDDLADALKNAKCGDTLLLPAGATYEVHNLPGKKCDDQHYITIRTDTPDSKLPPEGSRISPAWAGVASLPGRPAFAQPAGGATKLLPTIIAKPNNGVVVGDHLRFIGIEWTTAPDEHITRMIATDHSEDVIFDRNYMHAGEGSEVGHGVGMVLGSHKIAVINSYLSGFNCIARKGACTDATAVGGAHSLDPFGTFKIYNNFLEASGENILFGGGGSEYNPTDIEIRRNHFFRPMIWKEGEPGYTPSPKGTPYIVKNHLELKSAIRILIEANLLENCWGGFTQNGFSFVLAPVSQGSHCPKCRVNDVTVRYNRVRRVGGVLTVATKHAPERKGGGSPEDGGRMSIHDLIADEVHDRDFKGAGTFLKYMSAMIIIHDVAIDHVTSFGPGPLMSVSDKGERMPNFSLTNSVFAIGGERRPVVPAAPKSCAVAALRAGPQAVFDACFSNYHFDHNLLASEWASGFPKGNVVVSKPKDLEVRDLKDGIAKDPRLCHDAGNGCSKRSPGAGAASDGRDMGADVDAVEAAIAGVE